MNNYYRTIAIIVLIVTGSLLGWLVFKKNGIKTIGTNPSNQYDSGQNTDIQGVGNAKLQEQTNSEGGLSVSVQPINFAPKKPVQFKITFTTHQGDLDFSLTNQAVLIIDEKNNNQVKPVSWSGGSGGHHLSGYAVFPPIPEESSKITLIIKDIYGVKERVFLWSLN